MRTLAETFPPGEYIRDEMEARGWTLNDIHTKLGRDSVRCCAFDLAAYADDRELILGQYVASDLAFLFGGTATYWLQIDELWRAPPTDTGSVT